MNSFSEPMTGRLKFCLLLLVVLISLGAAGCGEQMPNAPPARVAFEGSLFRILDVNVPPRTMLQHSYANGVAMITITDGARIRMKPAGKDWGEEITPTAGSVTVAEQGEHGVQNAGEGAFQSLALENLKPGSGSTGAATTANGMTLVGESASLRVYDAQLNDKKTQITHIHTSPAVIILIQGRVLTQGPENKDKAIGEVASGLKQLDRPGQWVFVPTGAAHYVVRLGADQAHVVEVELR